MNAQPTTAPISTVVIGHVDHGKSTLIGRLLYDSGRLPQERISELQARAELYRRRFEFSHFLDAFEEEIAQERTIDTVRVLFHAGRTYEIADVPGHAEFTRNMLTGAGDARIAILVVSVVDGIQPQTLEHLRLVDMLGIEHLIGAVTKLDLAGQQEQAYTALVEELRRVLAGLGYTNPVIVPVVPTTGLNVSSGSKELSWYDGPSLVEAMDLTDLAPRSFPLRFLVQDTYDLEGGDIHVGRMLSGRLRPGEKMVFQSSGVEGTVVEIRDASGAVEAATSGDCVGIRLSNPGLGRGDVGGPPGSAPIPAYAVEADVVFLDDPPRPGEAVEIVCGPQRVEGIIESTRNSAAPEAPSKESTDDGLHPQQLVIRFPGSQACIERHSDFPELGRFVIRHSRDVCGVGIVRRILA